MRKCIVKARLTTTNKTLRRGLCLSAARLLFLAIKNQKISGTRKRASTAAYAWVLLVVSVCELIGIHQIRNPRSVLICFKPHPSRAPKQPLSSQALATILFHCLCPAQKKDITDGTRRDGGHVARQTLPTGPSVIPDQMSVRQFFRQHLRSVSPSP